MKCPSCGKEVPDSSAFCIHCGAKIDHSEVSTEQAVEQADAPAEDIAAASASTEAPKAEMGSEEAPSAPEPQAPAQNAPQSAPLPKPQLPKLKKGTLPIIIGVAAAAAIAIGVGVSNSRKVDLGKYIEITYSGYDGYGTADASFDAEKFAEDNADKIKLTDDAQQLYVLSGGTKEELIEYAAENCVEVNIENSTGLSNGDTVTATVYAATLPEYLASDIVIPDTITAKVSGLGTANTVDVLSSIPISFTGINGAGVPHADLDAINSQYGTSFASAQVTFAPASGLHNGDQVTITLSDSLVRDLADHAGIVPGETTETVTVSGLGEMATSAAGFTDDQLAQFIAQGTDSIRSVLAINNAATFTSAEYVGNDFLLSKKADAVNDLYVDENGQVSGDDSDPYNKLVMLFKVNLHYSSNYGEADVSYYDAVAFNNVYLDADGNPCVADITSSRLLGDGLNIPTGLEETGTFMSYGEIKVPTFNHGYYTIDDAQQGVVDRNAQNYTAEINLK